MPKECAFCPAPAVEIKGEHIWSDWMNALFPGDKFFTLTNNDFQNPENSKAHSWHGRKLNWEEPVVCTICNNGWMSVIENKKAKPVLADLILGKINIPITQEMANDIATFIFLKAVVLASMTGVCDTFFPRSERFLFRTNGAIPNTISMFLAGFAPIGRGTAEILNYGRARTDKVQLLVCNYGVGRFLAQVVSARSNGFAGAIKPSVNFDDLAVRFWPKIMSNFVWPAPRVLMDIDELTKFTLRWGLLDFGP
jgi:hypothetical protein